MLAVLIAAGGCGLRPLAAQEAATAVEADFQSRFTANADLAPGGGAVSQWSDSLDLSLPVAGSGAYGLGVDLIADRYGFGFNNFSLFLPGKTPPVANASVFTFQPTLVLTPAKPWSLIGSVLLEYAGADHASTNGAMLWGGSVAAAYQTGPGLKLGLGVEGMQQMKASAWYFPFPIVDWRISERWSLVSTDGETGRLAYAAASTVSLFGQLEFEEQDLRLARSSSLPSGIVRYEAYPLSLGVQWKPCPHLTVDLSAGEAVAQDYDFADAQGRLLRDSAQHAPALGTLELDCPF
jgi:hypothetical protein